MSNTEKAVSTVAALIAATKDKDAHHIVVHGKLTDAPSINLLPGPTLRGDSGGAAVIFAADGLQLSSDNRRLETAPDKRAIFNDTSVDSLGRIELRGVTTIGSQVRNAMSGNDPERTSGSGLSHSPSSLAGE